MLLLVPDGSAPDGHRIQKHVRLAQAVAAGPPVAAIERQIEDAVVGQRVALLAAFRPALKEGRQP